MAFPLIVLCINFGNELLLCKLSSTNIPHFKPICYIKTHFPKDKLDNGLIHKEVHTEPDLNSISLDSIFKMSLWGEEDSSVKSLQYIFPTQRLLFLWKKKNYCSLLPVVTLIKFIG